MNVKEVLAKHILADGMDVVMDMEKSHGSYVVDKKTGDEYLDMFTMFASASIGYNHPHVVENAAWLGKMAINKPTLSDIYSEEYAHFMEVFSRVAVPDYLQYAFFISGGGLAVENALKAAFDWKTRLNMQNGAEVEADIVIHFKEAFHGRTGYTMSLTNTADPRKYMYFPKFKWPRVTNPKMHFPLTEESINHTISLEEISKKEIEQAIAEYGNRVACIIVETIQGEGGDNFFRKEFHQYLREVTEQNDLMLIYDEVQCGVGITGKMWAHQHYDVQPDIISFGKKSQVCGILANKEKFDRVEKHVFKESSRLNSTFGGNFIDFCRFKLILEVIEKKNLVENAATTGAYLLEKLQDLQQKHPEVISNARGLGLWCAFDFNDPSKRPEFLQKANENKLIILPCGTHSIRFRPHLNAEPTEIDLAIDIIDKVL